jgi:regulator of nucleoside diphosphate kinase
MNMDAQAFDRILSEHDHVRLQALSRRSSRSLPGSAGATGIDELLDDAIVLPVENVPAHVATMHSEIVLRDPETGAARRITLCFPADADPSAGRISVLSPVGMSLLGRPAGSLARWKCPDGEERVAELRAVIARPEGVFDEVEA